MLIQLSSGGTSAKFSGIEESVAAISETLEYATDHADTSQQSVYIQSLVTELLRIIQGGMPAMSQHSVPAVHSNGDSPSATRSGNQCHMGTQPRHAEVGPMLTDQWGDSGPAAGWVLQTLSRDHAPVFQVKKI